MKYERGDWILFAALIFIGSGLTYLSKLDTYGVQLAGFFALVFTVTWVVIEAKRKV